MAQPLNIPIVILKMAQTLDGKIATAQGESKWITSPASRTYVQKLRASCDAVLVGKNTVLQDNPRLDIRGGKKRPQNKPCWRIIIDPLAEVKPTARVFKGKPLTVRVVNQTVVESQKMSKNLRPKAEIILPVSADKNGRVNLKQVLAGLKKLGIERLLVEGGGETAWSFLKGGYVKKIVWFMAPKILGGRDAVSSVEGEGFARLAQALAIKNMRRSENQAVIGFLKEIFDVHGNH